MKRLLIAGISIAFVIVYLISFMSVSRPVQAQATSCEDKDYSCIITGDGESCDESDAQSKAKSDCSSKLRECQQAKSTECAQFCARQQCLPSVSIRNAQECKAAGCAKGKFIWQIAVDIPIIGRCRLPIGIPGSGSVDFFICKSKGSSTVHCDCIEQARRAV